MSDRHPVHDANESIQHALHLNARRKLRIVAVIDIVKGAAITATVRSFRLALRCKACWMLSLAS